MVLTHQTYFGWKAFGLKLVGEFSRGANPPNLQECIIKTMTYFLILVLIAIVLGSHNVLTPYLGGDDNLYMVVANELVRGKILYKEIIDHKPPIIFVFYLLFHSLDWGSLWLLRIAQSLVLTLGSYFIFLLSKEINKNNIISALIASAFILTVYKDFNTEYLMMMFFLAGLYAIVKQRPFITGAVWGLAFLSKQVCAPAIFLISVLFILFKKNKKLAQSLLLIGGFMLPVIGFSLYFLWHGALYDAYLFSWKYNVICSAGMFNLAAFKNFNTYFSQEYLVWFVALLGAIGMAINFRHYKNFKFLSLIIMLANFSYYLFLSGGKHFHYWFPLLTTVFLMSAYLFYKQIKFHKIVFVSVLAGFALLFYTKLDAFFEADLLNYFRKPKSISAVDPIIKDKQNKTIYLWGVYPVRSFYYKEAISGSAVLHYEILQKYRFPKTKEAEQLYNYLWDINIKSLEKSKPYYILDFSKYYGSGIKYLHEIPNMQPILKNYDLKIQDLPKQKSNYYLYRRKSAL